MHHRVDSMSGKDTIISSSSSDTPHNLTSCDLNQLINMNKNSNKITHHSKDCSNTFNKITMSRKGHTIPHSDVTHSTTSSRQTLKPTTVQCNSVPLLRIMTLFWLFLSLLITVKSNTINNTNATLEISSIQQFGRRLTYGINQVFTYAASGQPFTFIVPYGVTSIYVEAIGAASGTGNGNQGKGAKVTSILSVIPGTTLYIYIGGKGTNEYGSGGINGINAGGFNGGGNGFQGGGGGGATDIRNGTGIINNRLLVAGGGGGPDAGCSPSNGGNGGSPNGISGGDGGCGGTGRGGGATQSKGGTNSGCSRCTGSLGYLGGNSPDDGGGGGGGGYYGGGAGFGGGSGGGGSSYSIGSGTTYPTPLTNIGDGSLTIYYDPQPSVAPTLAPSFMPLMPTAQPSGQPSREPSIQPSSQPSHFPSRQPTSQPSRIPSAQPSRQPSLCPNCQPSVSPTCQPTSQPLTLPSLQPSGQPSKQPSHRPSSQPAIQPTTQPSPRPLAQPTCQPSTTPSRQPTTMPSTQPSVQPSVQPSQQPSTKPSHHPTAQPSQKPMVQLTNQPTTTPSRQPTTKPSAQPSNQPTTTQPSQHPFAQPTSQPTTTPSRQPTTKPSTRSNGQPTSQPNNQPTAQPSLQPSSKPSTQPSTQPTCQPSSHPSLEPTNRPTRRPTTHPTTTPSSQPSSNPSESLLNRYFFNRSISLHVKVWSDFKIVLPFMFVNPVNGNGYEDVTIYNEEADFFLNAVALGGHNQLKILETHSMIFRDYSTRSVSVVGDVNGDGRDDIIIGVPYASRCYVLYGTKLGFINMTEGFTVYGADPSDLTGWSVSGAGDINSDTYADLIIGAPSAVYSDGVVSGVVYILYGGKSLDDIDLKHLNETRGFKLHSSSSQDAFGLSVSGAGDFNGDGFDDVIIGALRMADYFSGAAYIIYGGQKTEKHTSNMDSISDNNGIVLCGTYHSWFAYSVSGAGDANGDGFDDIIIGSTPRRATIGIQKSYLIYGTNISRAIDISSLASTHGLIIEGGGVIVSGIGDINNDGFDDVMMGSNIDLSLGCGIIIMQPVVETPTISPSNAPTKCPSMRPTRRPTICVTCKPSVLPTVTQTAVPTVVPSVIPSQPTRLPTALPSNPSSRPSSRPSQPTLLPSLEPSIAITIEPTIESSEVEMPSETDTTCPSLLPTQHPSSQSTTTRVSTHRPSLSSTPTRYPIVRPSISPTEVGNITYFDREVYNGMTMSRDRAVFVNYIVNTTEDVWFTHSGLVEMFTIVPNKDSRVKIDEFNVSCDIINLEYFESIHSLDSLNLSIMYSDGHLFGRRHLRVQPVRNVSLVIDLDNNQVILLTNISQSKLDETNFIFSIPSEQLVVSIPNKTHEKFIVSIISYVVVGLIVIYLLNIAYVHWQKRRRERRVVESKCDLDEIQANNVTYLSFTILDSDDEEKDDDNDCYSSISSISSGESKIDSEGGSQLKNNDEQPLRRETRSVSRNHCVVFNSDCHCSEVEDNYDIVGSLGSSDDNFSDLTDYSVYCQGY